MEAQPLRITVAADASVRAFCVRAGNPLPDARLLGRNQLARFIPKTVPPAIRSNGDGPGLDRRRIVANFDSRGERFLPSSCRFNRGCQVLQNWATSAPCRSMRASPTRIQSRRHAFWEGYIHTKNPEIDRVDDWGMALAVGPGQFIRDGESGATTNPGSEVTCSRPNPQDLHRRSTA